MTLQGLTILFEMGAAAMAIPTARVQPQYRPITGFLVTTTIANAGRLAIIAYVLAPARAAMRADGLDPAVVPFTGWAKAACDVELALFLL